MTKASKRRLVIHGVGNGQIIYADGSFTNITRAQDVTMEITSTEEDVFGGDGLFPFMSFIKERGGSLKITSAITELDQLKMTQGAEVTETNVPVFMFEDLVEAAAGSATLAKTTGVDTSTVVASVVDSGQVLKRVSTSPVADDEFSVTSAGAVTFGDDTLAGKVHFSYFYVSANAAMARLRTNTVPGVIEYRHVLETEDENGSKVRVHFRIYQAKCSGAFSFNLQRGTATAPSLEFKMLDPGRVDKNFFDFSVETIA